MSQAIAEAPPMYTDRQVASWLGLFAEPGHMLEIRVLRYTAPGKSGPSPVSRQFKAEELLEAAHEALRLSNRAPGTYFTLNPIRAGLGKNQAAKDTDVVSRKRLLIDIDVKREAKGELSSTDEEKAIALEVSLAVREYLDGKGWPEPVEADSGNGWHLSYGYDLPNDDASRDLTRSLLEALNRRFETDGARIDTGVFNASRITKVYGTRVRKGEDTPERPHRYSHVVKAPDELRPVSAEQIRDVIAELAAGPDLEEEIRRKQARAEAEAKTSARKPRGKGFTATSWTVEDRAVAYLSKCEPAVSGQHGHDKAFKAACKVGPGFNLPPEVAYRLLSQVYNPTCVPPWSDRELRHKVDDAYKVEQRRGWLLNDDGAKASANGHGSGSGHSSGTAEAPGGESPERPNEAVDDPHRLARVYRDRECSHPDGLTLRSWQGEWIRWNGAYRPVTDKDVNAELAAAVKHEFDRVNLVAIRAWEKAGRVDESGKPSPAPVVRKVTNNLIGNVSLALRGYTQLDASTVQPSWLDCDPPFSATEVLPTRNALVYLPGLVSGDDSILDPTPRFFCPYVLDYAFDCMAPRPEGWLAFLDSLWPDDPESIALLQEWFGHLLTPDTSHQKILLMVGPKRSGKGTIARIIRRLIGEANVANPTLSGIGSNFGLAPLIGKPAAIITDARLSGRSDIAQIVERLLSISGEDGQSVDRKHRESWSGKLPARFTIISNELPRLSDQSGALAGRMLILRLTVSFYGREDTALERKLIPELPGILLWAIGGWQRLRERGHFVQPQSSLELVEQLEDLASPVGAFLKERCVIGQDHEVQAEDLYAVWKEWCSKNGHPHAGTLQRFGRDLRSVLPTIKTANRRLPDGSRKRFYEGIAISNPSFF
ncbi:DNA primase family protein [Singulisphaera sp. PoT]|uniref:DNA primase family protein n=1 Tax=Singulisphaera sp. PoT TaxID=3411797 RepID=UPI003BF5D84C